MQVHLVSLVGESLKVAPNVRVEWRAYRNAIRPRKDAARRPNVLSGTQARLNIHVLEVIIR
ncbi:hypothetical protein D3C74_272270 [compost metagenome]